MIDIHKTNVPDLRIQYRYQTLLEERNLVLHFDEPDVYDYPGWPFTIPVISTDGGDQTFAMTELPALSQRGSFAQLSPSYSPQILLRKEIGNHRMNKPATQLRSSLVCGEDSPIDSQEGGSVEMSPCGSFRSLAPSISFTEVSVSNTNLDQSATQRSRSTRKIDPEPSLLREVATKLMANKDQPDHLTTLKPPHPVIVDETGDVQPLFKALSLSEPTSPSTESKLMSQSVKISSKTQFELPMTLVNQARQVIPGVLSAVANKRRTKSLERPIDVAENGSRETMSEGEDAKIRKKKDGLRMTPLQ